MNRAIATNKGFLSAQPDGVKLFNLTEFII